MKNMPLIPYEPVNMMWKPFFSDVSPAPARLLRSLWSEWALPDSPTCKWKKKISGVLEFWDWEGHKDEDAIYTHTHTWPTGKGSQFEVNPFHCSD